MFDRIQKGYLDGKEISEETLVRFDDDYSAKYLHLCFSPEFIMRVKEKEKPILSVNVGCLDEYIFNNGKPKKEVV